MTASLQSPRVRLRSPGELISAIPHLLGFHPRESLVLIAVHGRHQWRIGLNLRCDLPAPEHRPVLAEQLVSGLRQHQPTGVLAVVIGGGELEATVGLPQRELIDTLDEVFGDAGIPLLHAAWTFAIAPCSPWYCYEELDCSGELPDPGSSTVAAATAAAGLVTFESREQLAELIRPDDDAALARRSALLEQYMDAAILDRELVGNAAVERDFETVLAAVRDMAEGRCVLGDEEVARLALALADYRIRDASIGLLDGEQADAAEQLWLVLTRSTPTPEVAEPATLLALAAYLRGDGALAGVALDRALEADPGHRLSALLRRALDCAIPPAQLAVLTTHAADEAMAQFGLVPDEDDEDKDDEYDWDEDEARGG